VLQFLKEYQLTESFIVDASNAASWPLDVLKPLVRTHESFVAGGYFKDLFSSPPKDPRDIDVYFYNQESFDLMYDKFNASPVYKKKHRGTNAIAYEHIPTGHSIDLVTSIFGKPQEVLRSFDFTITKCALVQKFGEFHLLMHDQFMDHVNNKVLTTDAYIDVGVDLTFEDLNITAVKDIDCNKLFNRMIKYTLYGYKPSHELKTQLFRSIKVQKIDTITPVITEY